MRRLYGVSIDDPALYQLQIDSTALPLDACAELIVTAYWALTSPAGKPGSPAADRSDALSPRAAARGGQKERLPE